MPSDHAPLLLSSFVVDPAAMQSDFLVCQFFFCFSSFFIIWTGFLLFFICGALFCFFWQNEVKWLIWQNEVKWSCSSAFVIICCWPCSNAVRLSRLPVFLLFFQFFYNLDWLLIVFYLRCTFLLFLAEWGEVIDLAKWGEVIMLLCFCHHLLLTLQQCSQTFSFASFSFVFPVFL